MRLCKKVSKIVSDLASLGNSREAKEEETEFSYGPKHTRLTIAKLPSICNDYPVTMTRLALHGYPNDAFFHERSLSLSLPCH